MLKKALLAAFALSCALAGHAQNTTVTAGHIALFGGSAVTGRLCFSPTDQIGSPINITTASGQQFSPAIPLCFPVTSGVLSASAIVPDTALVQPVHACYNVTATDNTGNQIANYPCVQPTGSTWSFDAYVPTSTPNIPALTMPQFQLNGSTLANQGLLNFICPGCTYSNGALTLPTGGSGGTTSIAAGTILGNNTGATANAFALTPTQLAAMLSSFFDAPGAATAAIAASTPRSFFTVGSGGVTANRIVSFDASGNAIASTGLGFGGIASSTVAAAGTVEVVRNGIFACTFDGAAVVNDVVIASTTTTGECHDSGFTSSQSIPTTTAVIGTVESTVSGAGVNGTVRLHGPGIFGAQLLSTNVSGLGTAAAQPTSAFDAAGAASAAQVASLQIANNLSDVNNAATARGNLGAAPLASPALTGTPSAPTAAVGTNTTQLATMAAILNDAATVSPLIDGTAAVGTSTLFARQDHVHPTDTTRAPLASPTLTGTPAAPTAAVGTNTTQLATMAAILNDAATVSPLINGTAAVGTSTLFARQDHVHPTDTTRAPTASPVFTGTVTAPKTATNIWTANPASQVFYFEGSSITRAPHSGGSPTGSQLTGGGLTGNYGSLVAASYWGSGNGTYYNDGVDGSTSTSMLARYTTGNSTYSSTTVPSPHSICAAATAAGQRAFFFIDLTEVNNDQTNSIALATTVSNLQTLSADAMADGCFVVFLTSPDSNFANGFTVDQDVRNGTIASGNGTYPFVIDMASFIPNTLDTVNWDQSGPHPTVAGHKVIAADIVAFMTADGGYVNYSTPGVFAGPVQWNMYNRQLLYVDPANTGQIEIGSPFSNPAENLCFYQGSNGSAGNDNSCINADYNQFNFNYFSGAFKFSAGSSFYFKLGDGSGTNHLSVHNSSDSEVAYMDSAGRAYATAYVVKGTTFSVTGCGTATSLVGGPTAGRFAAASTTCAPVVTMGGVTAPSGFVCSMADRTTPADFTSHYNTSDTTTTATWQSQTVVSGDVMAFSCTPY